MLQFYFGVLCRLADKRMEAALEAVELYYKFYPSAALQIEPTKSDVLDEAGNTRWNILDAYLANSTSEHLQQFLAS